LASYFGIATWSYIFRGFDSWCDWQSEGIGFHCAGDFHQFVGIQPGEVQGYLSDGTVLEASSQGRSPLGAVISDAFSLLGSVVGMRGALVTWLTLLGALMVLPMVVATRRASLDRRVTAVLVLAVLTLPFWANIDRGQQAGLLVPLVFVYLVAVIRGRWQWVAIAAAAAMLIKPQFALLALPLLDRSHWRSLVIWLAAVLAGIGLSFVPYGAQAPDRFESWIRQLAEASSSSGTSGWDFSFGGALLDVASRFSPVLPDVASRFSPVLPIPGAQWGLLLGLVLLGALYLTRRQLPRVHFSVGLVAVVSLMAPLSYAYYLGFVLAVVAVVIGGYEPEPENVSPPTRCSATVTLLIAVALSLAPAYVPLRSVEPSFLSFRPGFQTPLADNFIPNVVSLLWLGFAVVVVAGGVVSSVLGRRPAGEPPGLGRGTVRIAASVVILAGVMGLVGALVYPVPSGDTVTVDGDALAEVENTTSGGGTATAFRLTWRSYGDSLPEWSATTSADGQTLCSEIAFRLRQGALTVNFLPGDRPEVVRSVVVGSATSGELRLDGSGQVLRLTLPDGIPEDQWLADPVCISGAPIALQSSPGTILTVATIPDQSGRDGAVRLLAILIVAGTLVLIASMWNRSRRHTRVV
jgi:hypothetical protein